MPKYKSDPYRARARFRSLCPDCGKFIARDDDITVWPKARRGNKARHWKCSESDYRRFEGAAFDEAVLTGQW